MTSDSTAAVPHILAAFDDARAGFIAYLNASRCSPNTACAYGQDLLHLRFFLARQELDWHALTPASAIDLLIHLWEKPSHRRGAGHQPSLATVNGRPAAVRLSSATVNRVLSAVSSFYEWAR